MSTQGTLTVGRTGHVPIWPFIVAVLVVAIGVVGVTLGLTLSKDRTPEIAGAVVSTETVANSSAAIREGGVYAPSAVAPQLVPADFASASADQVRARYAAMARFGRDATAGAIVIDGWVCHQCR
jgi:hypothetical protein